VVQVGNRDTAPSAVCCARTLPRSGRGCRPMRRASCWADTPQRGTRRTNRCGSCGPWGRVRGWPWLLPHSSSSESSHERIDLESRDAALGAGNTVGVADLHCASIPHVIFLGALGRRANKRCDRGCFLKLAITVAPVSSTSRVHSVEAGGAYWISFAHGCAASFRPSTHDRSAAMLHFKPNDSPGSTGSRWHWKHMPFGGRMTGRG